MFKECEGLIILEDFFRDKFQYKFTTYEDLLKQDFISFEGNGFSSRFWIKYMGEEYLFKETGEDAIIGELLSLEFAKILGVPCANYRACKLTRDGNVIGVLSQKVYNKDETLILGAQIIQEFLNNYYENTNMLELLHEERFRKLYGIPDNLMNLKDNDLLKYVFNNLNNLEQLWRIGEGFFKDNPSFTFMLVNYLVETFLFDIFLMEADRHVENWGIIKTQSQELFRTCPLYDNAAILGINKDTNKKIDKINSNKKLFDMKKSCGEFENMFYADKLLLACSEDDILNARARKRKTNMKILEEFLRVSDSNYIDIFFYFKELLERVNIDNLFLKIERENGMRFSDKLKDYLKFAYYKNLEYINNLIVNRGLGGIKMGNLDELLEVLEKKNLSRHDALELLKSNYIFCNLTPEEIETKIFAVFNGPFLYAVLYCVEDYYEWSIFDRETRKFSKMNKKDIYDDYIIKMVINNVNKMALLVGKQDICLQFKMQEASIKEASGYKIK